MTLTQFNIGEPQLYIRGVGTTERLGGRRPSIGVSIDEVSIGRARAGALAFLDIQRVEVLRGPQEHAVRPQRLGRGAEYLPRRPVFGDSGGITAQIGGFDEYGVEGILNPPAGRRRGDASGLPLHHQ